jgi:hypothetical protein
LAAIGACLFAVGSADALRQVAPEFPQPKILGLRHAVRLVNVYSLVITAATGFLFVALVPQELFAVWHSAPGLALALNLSAPAWMRSSIAIALAVAAIVFLTLTLQRAMTGAQHVLARLSEDDLLAESMRALHPRFGTPFHLIDLTAVATLVRLWSRPVKSADRRRMPSALSGRRSSRSPRLRGFGSCGQTPVGSGCRSTCASADASGRWAWSDCAALGVPSAYLLLTGNPASLAGAALLVALTAIFSVTERAAAPSAAGRRRRSTRSSCSARRSSASIKSTSRRNVLVLVRKPHFMAHLTAALQAAGDREIVVATFRLLGIDVSDELATAGPTDDELRVLGEAAALAERYGRAVRLLIVPSTNIFDAIVATVLRLRSSEIYVGESETLAADEQARILGEAWERAAKTGPLDVRLVIHHASGRTATTSARIRRRSMPTISN